MRHGTRRCVTEVPVRDIRERGPENAVDLHMLAGRCAISVADNHAAGGHEGARDGPYMEHSVWVCCIVRGDAADVLVRLSLVGSDHQRQFGERGDQTVLRSSIHSQGFVNEPAVAGVMTGMGPDM